MKPFSSNSKIGLYINSVVKGYNHEKYWKRRRIVTNPVNHSSTFVKLYYLYYLKRKDARFNCSFGTNINSGAQFKSPPNLPHGPYGIIVGHHVRIGKNCTIYQQVTIASQSVEIGNNVLIGAGAKILNNIKIGNNVKIGANAVVVVDIPDDATVVMHKPKILTK